MESFADHLFTESVRALQEADGTAEKYAAMYQKRTQDALDDDTRAFIGACTSFYMATVSANGWPYIQHRGGPAGFLKVRGPDSIGFADYRGNRQYISQGNLSDSDRVALFLMDYPRKARLKLIGHAAMVPADADPDLAQALATDGQGRVERLVTIQITALDWNCPQFIEPRYTQAEVEAMLAPRMADINAHIEMLESRLTALKPDWKEDP
ncbi:MAG: pyridoxamine 5'-phosphate oxidase family protein [Pseudomonadota bacterium]